jgi:ankyrin repeat protein
MGYKRSFSKFAVATSLAAMGLMLAQPAAAQFSDSYSFLQAVRDRDADKVMPLINKPGAPVLATRDRNTGESATHIVVKRHDVAWLAFLLDRGAPVDPKDNQGLTPLMVAAQTGDVESARLLLGQGAKPNAVNNSGETSLVMAVHRRDTAMIRLLITSGADPRISDTIAGKSADDYAKEDPRGAAVVRVLAEAKPSNKPSAKISGPVIR